MSFSDVRKDGVGQLLVSLLTNEYCRDINLSMMETKSRQSKQQVAQATLAILNTLQDFVSPAQRRVVANLSAGEEGEWFLQKMQEIRQTVDTMPKSYETDGQGDNAVAHLHYFGPSCDFYITEKDMCKKQHQAFGSASYGHGAEMGYISLCDLLRHGVELDFHFTPRSLKDLKASGAIR
jgi:hypothetical protein